MAQLYEVSVLHLENMARSQRESIVKFVARGWSDQAARAAQELVRVSLELEFRREWHGPEPPLSTANNAAYIEQHY